MFNTFHSGFVGCDGGTLNGYVILLGSQCRVDGDLVISLVTVRQTKVIILQLNVNIGQDELKVNKIKPTKVSTNYISSFAFLKNRFPTRVDNVTFNVVSTGITGIVYTSC